MKAITLIRMWSAEPSVSPIRKKMKEKGGLGLPEKGGDKGEGVFSRAGLEPSVDFA